MSSNDSDEDKGENYGGSDPNQQQGKKLEAEV